MPTPPSTAAPSAIERQQFDLATSAEVTLGATWHRPAGPSRGVAIVAPGVAVPARVVEPLGDHLAADGWTALSFDFAGIATSRRGHPRDVPGGMVEWATRDLAAVIDTARAEAGDLPVVLVGHSAGAWLATLTDRAQHLDAVVAIASMAGWWGDFKRDQLGRMLFAMYAGIPLANLLTGYIPGQLGLGEDAPGEAMAQWASWCRKPGFYNDDPDVTTHFDLLTAPVLAVLPTDDEWATEKACRAIWDRCTASSSVTLRTVDPEDHGGKRIGHIGLLRDRFADTVWTDLTTWLDEHTRNLAG